MKPSTRSLRLTLQVESVQHLIHTINHHLSASTLKQMRRIVAIREKSSMRQTSFLIHNELRMCTPRDSEEERKNVQNWSTTINDHINCIGYKHITQAFHPSVLKTQLRGQYT
ncbi:hypothetical protein DICVIV_07232 [Dictyocaulus viviparus]|uniref:Uncharacterized protein n=1 Tax=Dictyocaulus viviparus TaxID=29172 RepID=A0A0D8XQ09_DICVI|nr:hypothetical protein DICVIV_07232 [Dictyocaulus viviparus]